jgi:Protein of unknown function (DUF3025)
MALTHTRPFEPAFIDESPWYWPIHGAFCALPPSAEFPSAEALSALYAARVAPDCLPLRFAPVPKAKPRRRPPGPVALDALYEGRIAERSEVPQRPDDWHDLFNALAFVAFPRAKAALHLRQYTITRERVGPTDTRLPGARTREQDALALFDEGGVVVVTEPALAAQIDVDADDVSALVIALCSAGRAHVVPFGHALWEHLVAGLPCPLAAPCVLGLSLAWHEPDALLRTLDTALAAQLADRAYFMRPARTKGLALAALPCVIPR